MTLEKRNQSLDAMRKYYAPISGKVSVDHHDMIDPLVQMHGDVAVLSYGKCRPWH